MMMGAAWEPPPEQTHIPPDPTHYDLTWGGPYPCLAILQNKTAGASFQCGGMMQPKPRCFRYEGVLWRRFVCSKCGRAAADLKDAE